LLPALLSEIDVLIGGDTGVTHLAAALGTPVVALFGPTDPALTAPRGAATIIHRPVPCAPCFYRVCPIDHPCMRGIDAPAVRDAARAVPEAAPAVRGPAQGAHATGPTTRDLTVEPASPVAPDRTVAHDGRAAPRAS
jgi:glycosyl transferase family 9 (putative heptosyltransferase)